MSAQRRRLATGRILSSLPAVGENWTISFSGMVVLSPCSLLAPMLFWEIISDTNRRIYPQMFI